MARQAHALDEFVSVGIGTGGTNLSQRTGQQTYEIQAGEGAFLSGGIIYALSPTTPHRFEVQTSVGYLFRDTGEEKDLISWRRIPIDLVYFYRNERDRFRIGYGLTYQIANKLSAKGVHARVDTEVDNALGWTVTAEKIFPSAVEALWSVGVRYNWIRYTSGGFTREANGDAVFLTLTYMTNK